MAGNNFLIFLVAVAIVAGSLLQLWLAWASYRRDQRQATRSAPARNPGTDPAVGEQLAIMRRRLAEFEQRMSRLQQPQPQPPAVTAPANPAYEIAINLARKGAGVDDLVAMCKLTRAEAELMLRIYAQKPQDPGRTAATADTKAGAAAAARRRTNYIV